MIEIEDEIDPIDAAEAAADTVSATVQYDTGHGMDPVPITFCAFSTPSDRCSADNLIDMSDLDTQVKMGKSNGGRGLDRRMAICLNHASNGGRDRITLESYIDSCGSGQS